MSETAAATKTCHRCKAEKPRSEFYTCRRWQDGLDLACKSCRKEMNDISIARVKADPARLARWSEKNKAASKKRRGRMLTNREVFAEEIERNRARARAYYRANKDEFLCRVSARRAKLEGRGGSHSSEAWRQLKDLFGNRCLCCGLEKRLTKDHVVPVACGGSDDIENIQPLCLRCNKSKFTRSVDYRTRDKVATDGLNDVGRLLFDGGGIERIEAIRKRIPTSRFTGVAWADTSWRAYIQVNRKLIHLGRYQSEEDAARAYNAASVKLLGASAYVNAI